MSSFCVKDGQTILLIGDSITDCGRQETENYLGNGYVYLFSKLVTVRYPERKIKYINKGISGNCIPNLKERWTDDVLVNKPDWLTILVGINDLHCYLNQPDCGLSPKKFEETYNYLLNETKKVLNIPIVLIQPFYISRDNTNDTFRSRVLKLLSEYLAVVEKMAKTYNTRLVKTQQLFQTHLRYRDADTFCPEPVHPNPFGHLVIAEELFNVLKEGNHKK